MQTFSSFLESNKANKFNIYWQIVRTKARAIKDVNEKISYVLEFLKDNPNIHNYQRVMNWVKMTGVAYPEGSDKRQAFIDAQVNLEQDKDEYSEIKDNENDLSTVPLDDLKLVYNDLKKRKYGFQYKTVPQAHINFVKRLEHELKLRDKE